MKGIIALDIDGTITADHHAISPDVVQYLSQLTSEGWMLMFITGRTFTFGYSVLRFLPFPYFFAVQNGAIILEMPSRRILAKKYLSKEIFLAMEEICDPEPTDFVVYTGIEYEDRVYYRPQHFSAELSEFLSRRQVAFREHWTPVENYDHLTMAGFPSVKCIGKIDSVSRIVEQIEGRLGLHVPVIKDPLDSSYLVAQSTHPDVHKGQALQDLIQLRGITGTLIAAGDDNNDKSMLEAAHIKVVMSNAPQELLNMADIVAPPATQQGIIQGLKAAVELSKRGLS